MPATILYKSLRKRERLISDFFGNFDELVLGDAKAELDWNRSDVRSVLFTGKQVDADFIGVDYITVGKF